MVYITALQSCLLAFARVVDELYGHYLDSTTGFMANERMISESQVRTLPGMPPGVNRDELSFFYGIGDPNDPKSRVQHRTTQGAYKARNAKGGTNHIRAGQLLVVLLFEYWESEHRSKVAKAIGIDRDELKVPFIGDLRLLRQDVIHHQGVVRHETVKKLEILGGFSQGAAIVMSGKEVWSAASDRFVSSGVCYRRGAPGQGKCLRESYKTGTQQESTFGAIPHLWDTQSEIALLE